MQKKDIEIFYPASLTAWRKWLQKNHLSKQAVWLVFYNKSSEKKSITRSNAVDAALCSGWIDSKKIKIDQETSHQFFTGRKANSTWLKNNKEKVELIIEAGLMKKAGLAAIERAQQNDCRTMLDEVEALIIPKDLEAEFKTKPNSKDDFLSPSKSVKKVILQ